MADAGWYPDPGGGPQLRYFDGAAWTEAVRPFPAPEEPPASDGSGTTFGPAEAVEPATAAPDADSNGGVDATPGTARRWLAAGGLLAVFTAAGIGIAFLAGGGSQDAVAAATTAERDAADDAADNEAEEAEEAVEGVAEAPAPDPAPEPVDLRERNWSRHPWPTTCNALYEEINATLGASDVFELPGVLEFASSGGSTPIVFSVWVDDVVFGDVTGNGRDDAVFRTECFHGNAAEQMLEVWSTDVAGQPELLPTVAAWSKFAGVVESFSVDDGAIRVSTSEGLPDDDHPHLNGYPIDVVTDWRFGDGGWTATEISRSEPPSLTACASPNSSPEKVVDCLLEAVLAGDHGAALLAADLTVAEAFIEARDEGWLEHWEFTGCGEPILLTPASGRACFFYDPPPEGSPFHGVVIEIAVESTSKGWFLTEIDYVG
jgi:hypothetical protein